MIERLQNITIFCAHNTVTEYGFLSGVVIVRDGFTAPCEVVSLDTDQKYLITEGIAPGVYYQQEITAVPV